MENKPMATPLLFKILAGLLLLFALLLGFSLLTKLFDYESIARFWPLLIVLIGLAMASGGPKLAPAGLLTMLLGLFIIFNKLGLLDSDAGHAVEVILMVLLSITVLLIAGTLVVAATTKDEDKNT